jgi:arabinogalactan endo-1,4-beta-galactosidase
MDDISKRYNKDVIVVEAAYAYTLANCDNAENSFQAKEEKGRLSRHRTGAI